MHLIVLIFNINPFLFEALNQYQFLYISTSRGCHMLAGWLVGWLVGWLGGWVGKFDKGRVTDVCKR